MRKVLSIILAYCVGIGVADAAVRDTSSVSRENAPQIVSSVSRTANSNNIVSRAGTMETIHPRNTSTAQSARTTSSRNISNTVMRTAASTPRSGNITPARIGTTTTSRVANSQSPRVATIVAPTNSKTFGTGYNTCRDAYFTCMDQFCASADDAYRRCVCSSRLYDIKNKQRALNQTADQLQDFKDLNIEVIPKTAAEVQAMQHASEGEMVANLIKDKSSSIAQLSGISSVLSKTKSKSLSTAGTLDIAGDINAIWATTDLTSGLNISNLTGETLYNAVHEQCVNLIAEHCESKSLLNMVVSAYSMYIENDCSLISNALDKKKLSADASIRETEREMNTARLENYNAHNATSINDCISMIRSDVTADAACGSNYIHCLDTTGLYLNKSTGAPIYSSNFYQLGSMLSLSGDILSNRENRMIVAELNRKRIFAENSLDTCRDLSNNIWDEFMRQAIIEIYQGQQTKIRNVKNECLDVVNQCYDEKNNSLKDFSNVKEQLLLGTRLELSEELCREKLNACSNLYGGGTDGMEELINTMSDIVTQQIAQNCFATLQEYVQQLCAVPTIDSLHTYPYACRAYAPGERMYAEMWSCNTENKTYQNDTSATDTSQVDTPTPIGVCSKRYKSCNPGYYMKMGDEIIYPPYTGVAAGNICVKCPAKGCPTLINNNEVVYENPCGADYAGSLYQKLVRYAVNACMRPRDIDNLTNGSKLPSTLLQDVNQTMDLIRVSMASVLKTECERLGGYWMSSQWTKSTESETGIKLHAQFYNETGASTKWGYCASPETVTTFYGTSE